MLLTLWLAVSAVVVDNHWRANVAGFRVVGCTDDHVVRSVMAEVSLAANLTFVEGGDDIIFSCEGADCLTSSPLGPAKDAWHARLRLGWCYKSRRGIMHELLHRLGFVHEMNRVDVPMAIDRKALDHNWQLQPATTPLTTFDPCSVMMYPENVNATFAREGLRALQRCRLRNQHAAPRQALSVGDATALRKLLGPP